jgi:hypothetical protein
VGWTMLYLFVALKLPILAAGYLIWWAVHQEPEYPEDSDTGGGGRPRPHPAPKLPHAPRRGPHHERAPASPSRIRSAANDRLRARGDLGPL